MSKIEELLSELERLTPFIEGDEGPVMEAARILRAAHDAGFVTGEGEVRKVHSTGRIDVPETMYPPLLPITKDDVIVIPGGTHYVWYPGDTKGRRVWLSGHMQWYANHHDGDVIEAKRLSECYSTKAAAEAGRETDAKR